MSKFYDAEYKLPTTITMEDLERIVESIVERAKLDDYDKWYMTEREVKKVLGLSSAELRSSQYRKLLRRRKLSYESVYWKPDVIALKNSIDGKSEENFNTRK